MPERLFDELRKRNIKFKPDADIGKISSLGIPATALVLVEPKDTSELITVLDLCCDKGISYRVIGRMSNTMPRGERYPGVLIRTTGINRCRLRDGRVYAECGCSLSSLVRLGSEGGYGGIEALYHIPGTLGGAVYGNAGACGTEICDVFISGRVYYPKERRIICVDNEQMRFSYRKSALSEAEGVFLDGELRLVEKSREEILSLIEAHRIKRQNQPKGVKTLGSTFKRAGDLSAGYYIDRAGLKGFSIGGAEVSRVHAGFIVNRGGATAEDVLRLIEHIKTRVFECFGILLEEEIQIL
nr:UDP-N-acetylmuramate dehydrogenase [Clostridia bacterium]